MSFASRTQAPQPTATVSFGLSAAGLLQRKCACGPHTLAGECEECRGDRPRLQRKPAVSTPGDRFEREADDAADRVMRMLDPRPVGRAPAAIQTQCADCEDDDQPTIRTRRAPTAHPDATLDTEAAARVAARGGATLPGDVRAFFEARFGHDFGRVRVHADGDAAAGARAVHARAYTLGRDIVFAAGEYAPATTEGRRLLAHELAHVVQQRAAGPMCGEPGASSTARGTAGAAQGMASTAPGIASRAQSTARDAPRQGNGGRSTVDGTPGTASDAPRTRSAGRRVIGSAQGAASDTPSAVRGTPGAASGATAGGPGASVIQRTCGAALGPPAPDCTPSEMGVVGWPFRFRVNCDDMLPGEAANVSKFKAGSTLNIHGFASIEGPAAFNMELSCHRANQVAALVRASRPDCSIAGVFKHGASPQPQPGAVPDANPRAFWRTVIVEEVRGAPEPALPKSVCGPDATDWLLAQMVAAKKNTRVLAVRNKLDIAALFAGNIKPVGQIAAAEILEGALLEKVAAARAAAGNPPATGDAKAQIAQAAMGAIAFDTAKLAALGLDLDAITTLEALRDASLLWKALVGTGKPLDFKKDPSTMQDPRSASCPDDDCTGTITLCPGSKGSNCFGKDLPGNIVYAAVGGFVGFSELALQLGSQFAQLASTKTWDPPEDTQMISFGFALPHPLPRADFCSALQGAKGSFAMHQCRDCTEPTTAAIIDPK